jgi:two-component system, response regulator RegA
MSCLGTLGFDSNTRFDAIGQDSKVGRTPRFVAPRTLPLATALISHPNPEYCEALVQRLMPGNIRVRRCSETRTLRQELLSLPPNLLVTELRLSDGPTMRIIERIRQRHPETRLVVVTAYGSVASAVRCFRLGVEAYYSEHELVHRLRGSTDWDAVGSLGLGSGEPLRLERAVWEYLNRVVERSGSISRGATALGLDRRSLRRMLGKHAPPP